MLPPLTLVLGGASSGKSGVAEKLIERSGLDKIYVATSQIWDEETQFRVDRHVAQRGPGWQTIEVPVDVPDALAPCTNGQAVLLDCATLWLTNVMLGDHDLETAQASLLTALAACDAPVVVVSNEVGQGIVPENALARHFREAQGRLNIALAAQADCVLHVLAGLVDVRKGEMP
ncbi:bifunctional adenosylcobinamide kinase/adenosylcobinamide-phosphate guanylyltransferase [Tateyamaria sp. SN6-1]|uniref:bifunctional adenosylcobinamide kinase/adenosylcobinamide-phosphate guanylyltransferase n=1 Tax=Tateyamaria sp. SN6-1 TaxID=3092148 RepID=UPI0039F4C990